jgi:hypothetical protein
MTTLIVWRLMEAPLGTSSLREIVGELQEPAAAARASSCPQPAQQPDARAREELPRVVGEAGRGDRPLQLRVAGPTLLTITASTDPARSFGAPRDTGSDPLTEPFDASAAWRVTCMVPVVRLSSVQGFRSRLRRPALAQGGRARLRPDRCPSRSL